MLKTKKPSFYKTAFTRLVACLLIAIMCVSALAACNDSEATEDQSTEDSALGIKTTYSVRIKASSGLALSGIEVHVYTDNQLNDLAGYAKTNEAGEASFSLNKSGSYAIVLSSPPKGYKVEQYYSFIGESATIVLESGLITDGELSTANLSVGDVMYDFAVNTPDGAEIKLSEILKTKKAVLINFWYTTCTWCVEEFPVMNDVYANYKDEIEIIALNPFDDNNAIKSFQAQYELDFPMASCPASWANTFSVSSYPTSLIIDRYGMICVFEEGAIVSQRPFVSAFEHFISDDYSQKLCYEGIGELVDRIKPNKTMPESSAIAEAINNGEIEITYRPETEDDDSEYIWPFVITEKLGESVICASNIGIDDSAAIIYADVTLKAGQALGFDYFASSEHLCDILYVIVNDDDVFQISGVSENDGWKTCYPCVADEDGVYEIALCYFKDSDTGEGDDTVYIDNIRVVDVDDIDVETFLPREAAVPNDDGGFTYAEIVFNEKDGYYHVGKENGPLLLANLMNYSQFNEELSVYELVYNGDADKDGVSLYDKENGGKGMVKYFSYASNASLNGVCTVNKELSEMLKQVAEVAGFDGDENEWLKICVYYEVFGPTDKQLQDPIKGLSPKSAFETKLGKNIATNYFYYDRAIIPRGLMSEFIPSKWGVYRFTSKSDYKDGIDAWIFDANGNQLYTYEHDERMYIDDKNCSIVYYMEAGTPYYINMAFWDVYETGYIYYDVEYIGSTFELFRCASPGYFTYDSDASGDVMYDVIDGGIKPKLVDGKYYDSEDGSLIYADFTGLTTVFSQSIVEMIEMNGFDFSKSETDDMVLSYLKKNDNDVDKTIEYLKKLWGEEYDENAKIYQIEDVFAGRYHGKGENLTDEMREYAKQIIKSKDERDGCVVVDERLAEILGMLMDKFTFEGVENSWLKVCYYYDYLGPAKSAK